MQNISKEDRNKIDDYARLSILKSIFVKEWQESCRKELAFMSVSIMVSYWVMSFNFTRNAKVVYLKVR